MSSHHETDDGQRVAPDGELFRRARDRAEALCPRRFTPTALARRHRQHARSEGALRVRIVNFERGELATMDADLHEALTEEMHEVLTDAGTLDDVHLAQALEDDAVAAKLRAVTQHHARLVARREREIADAEDRLAWLRDGLEPLRAGKASADRMLAEWQAGSTAGERGV